MSKGALYPKLAFLNIKNNRKFYIPYLLTGMGVVMMGYVMLFIAYNPGMEGSFGGRTVASLMMLGCVIMAIFSAVLLFYTNSFLMKRRKMELGLYVVLGMEKRHLGLVQLFESLYVGLLSLVGGLVLGVLFSRLTMSLLVKLTHVSTTLVFSIDPFALAVCLVYFTAVFFVIFLCNLVTVGRAKPVELLQGSKVGEKEPKVKWPLTVLGLLCLGGGYAIAVLVKNPLQAILLFFVAVLLVIAGTYLLFTTGSIAVLKALKSNKNYYYKTRHFIGVSGMIYRMKQNAVGLANICILSTMVLVMLSSTVSLNIGTEDILNVRYPADVVVHYFYADDAAAEGSIAAVKEIAQREGIALEGEPDYYRYIPVVSELRDGALVEADEYTDEVSEALAMTVLSASEYNRLTGNQREIKPGEALASCKKVNLPENFKLLDMDMYRTGPASDFPVRDETEAMLYSYVRLVISDEDYEKFDNALCGRGETVDTELQTVGASMTTEEEEDRKPSAEEVLVLVNVEDKQQAERLYDVLSVEISEKLNGISESGEPVWWGMYVDFRQEGEEDFYSMYGGLLFLGICLGLMFTMATILIIYYKQITEGYNDRDRFIIMRKVGLSDAEIRKTIRAQILTVFFLPLIAAVVHICFAYNIIARMLSALNMTNIGLYILCTAASVGVFALLYLIVFAITAREYYKIIS